MDVILNLVMMLMTLKFLELGYRALSARIQNNNHRNIEAPTGHNASDVQIISTPESSGDFRGNEQTPSEEINSNEAQTNEMIKAQKEMMEMNCEDCRKSMKTDLFPASMELEKIIGASEFPHENEIVSFLDLHICKCSCKHLTLHQQCASPPKSKKSTDPNVNTDSRYFCVNCESTVSEIDVALTALKCLEKSTKPYEFAYIYKKLKKYRLDFIPSMAAEHAPNEIKHRVRNRIEKCNFKGKRSMLARLDLDMMDMNSDSQADIINSFLQNSLGDSDPTTDGKVNDYLNRLQPSEETKKILLNLLSVIKEQHVKTKRGLCKSLMYVCFKHFSKKEILRIISKMLLSEQYFLLNTLQTATQKKHFFRRYKSLRSAKKLPRALNILIAVENNFKDPANSILLGECIDKKADAVAACISAKPFKSLEFEYAPIFIYLKRIFKLGSKRGNGDKKKNILFYESLLSYLLYNMVENPKRISNSTRDRTLAMLLKVIIFYSKKSNFKLNKSPFVKPLFMLLDAYLVKDNLKLDLTAEEHREMLLLRALNHNTPALLDNKTNELSDRDTQMFLVKELIKRGRSFMEESFSWMPWNDELVYKNENYERFIHDLCYSPMFPSFVLPKRLEDDISDNCKFYRHSDTGFLPFCTQFYMLVDFENWQESDVLEWCERVNFIDFLYDPHIITNKQNKYFFVRKHFKTILKYILDNAGDNIYVECELVARCWRISATSSFGCREDIFTSLAAAKNGYFHANIYFLMNRKRLGKKIARDVIDKIHALHKDDNSVANDALVLQKKFIEFIKSWEETDIILSCDSVELRVIVRSLLGFLQEIRTTGLHTQFKDIVENSNAICKIKKEYKDFYRVMAESLDFIPQAALDLYVL
ncbi:hypothetical protein ENBRE01_1503 [Enteropsectra breve]|nr:hypothetical protein ENBRE01_1503 [Enteropsectra breve]